MSIHVVAILRAREGKEDELRSLLEGLLEPTWAEAGCVSYHMHTNVDDAQEFTFIEEWTDSAALDAHLGTPHLQNALASFPDLLADDLALRRLTRVG